MDASQATICTDTSKTHANTVTTITTTTTTIIIIIIIIIIIGPTLRPKRQLLPVQLQARNLKRAMMWRRDTA